MLAQATGGYAGGCVYGCAPRASPILARNGNGGVRAKPPAAKPFADYAASALFGFR